MSTEPCIGPREHTLFAWTPDGLAAERYHAQFVHRFWAKVSKAPGQGPKGECWEWQASQANGYGRLMYRYPEGFRPMVASIASFFIHTGRMPEPGLFVCHRCDNPACVRGECTIPGCEHLKDSEGCESHLFLGTPGDNTRDAQAKGRMRVYVERRSRAERARFNPEQLATIKAARQSLGESIYDIADLLGVDFSFVSLFEDGKRPTLPIEKAETLLAHLQLDMAPATYTHFVGRRYPKSAAA